MLRALCRKDLGGFYFEVATVKLINSSQLPSGRKVGCVHFCVPPPFKIGRLHGEERTVGKKYCLFSSDCTFSQLQGWRIPLRIPLPKWGESYGTFALFFILYFSLHASATNRAAFPILCFQSQNDIKARFHWNLNPCHLMKTLTWKPARKSKSKLQTGTGRVQICWDLRLSLTRTQQAAGSNGD